MFRSTTVRVVAAVLAAFGLIVLVRFQFARVPASHFEASRWEGSNRAATQILEVAFIPVTCHLTCPVTDYASKTSTTGTRFDAIRFTEFPTIVEALKTKKLLAGFLTVPLAMRMREQGAPIKMCCLGHRDGSQLVIRRDIQAKDIRDLRGLTIARPSAFSNENFFVTRLMRDHGMQPGDVDFVDLPPPDMVSALAARAIDGFIVAEPYCGKAELDGVGKILYYAKDIWPNYISCCLVVHEDLIRENPEVVRDLVRGIAESGEWTERHRLEAATLVAPYFRQDPKLLRYILTQPADRVTYRNLNPSDDEIQKIMEMGIDLGFLKKRTPMSELIDRSFFPAEIQPARIELSRMEEIVPQAP